LGDARFVTGRGHGWLVWSDGAIELYGRAAVINNGLATVTYPIALPEKTYVITVGERLATDPGNSLQIHTSMIIDGTVTNTGFQARCQSVDGSPSSYAFSWHAYYSPV